MTTFQPLTPAQAEHVQQLYRELIAPTQQARKVARKKRAAYDQFIGIGFSPTVASELSEIYQQPESTK